MRGKSAKKHGKTGKKEKLKFNSRNIFLLLLVIGVVAVSGCIFGGGGGVSTGGNGVVISDFLLSASDVSDCDKSVRASLELENNGGNSIPQGDLMACINGENFPGKTSEQMWAIDSAQTDKVCQASAKKLDAPDTVKNIPGGAASFRWTLFSPFTPFPLTRSDDFEGRVFYKYGSRTLAKVFIISESELAAVKQRREALPSAPEIDKTSSPVDISVDVSQPIIGANGDTFTLKVTLSNVGGGTVFDKNAITFGNRQQVPSIPEDKLNLITVDVDTPLNDGGTSEAGFCENELKNVELRRGSTVTIPCDIKINSQITKLQSFPILLTASFGYFVDSNNAPVAISGKKGKADTSCEKGTSSGNVFDFSLLSNPSSLSLTSGSSVTTGSTITATLNSGAAQAVSFGCSSGLPSGATCAFDPSSITPATAGATSLLTISNTSKINSGTYSITVSGTGGGLTDMTTVSYVVP